MDISLSAPIQPVSYYTITATPTSGNTVSQTFNGTQYTITGLTFGKQYTLSLVADNADGTSGAATATATTKSAPETPTDFTTVSATSTTINISFTAPPQTITQYNIRAVDVDNDITQNYAFSGTTTYSVFGLTHSTYYYLYLTAINGDGTSGEVLLQTNTSFIPSAPTNLSVVSITNSDVVLSFTPPPQIVNYYTVVATPTTSGLTLSQNFSGGSPITLYGLTASTSYTFKLFASNDYGTSAFASVNGTTTA